MKMELVNTAWDEFLELSRSGELEETDYGFVSKTLVGFDETAKENYFVCTSIAALNHELTASELHECLDTALSGSIAAEGEMRVQYAGVPLMIAISHGTTEEIAVGSTPTERTKYAFRIEYDPGDGFTRMAQSIYYDSDAESQLFNGVRVYQF